MIRPIQKLSAPPVPPRPSKTVIAEALAKSRKISPVRVLYATAPENNLKNITNNENNNYNSHKVSENVSVFENNIIKTQNSVQVSPKVEENYNNKPDLLKRNKTTENNVYKSKIVHNNRVESVILTPKVTENNIFTTENKTKVCGTPQNIFKPEITGHIYHKPENIFKTEIETNDQENNFYKQSGSDNNVFKPVVPSRIAPPPPKIEERNVVYQSNNLSKKNSFKCDLKKVENSKNEKNRDDKFCCTAEIQLSNSIKLDKNLNVDNKIDDKNNNLFNPEKVIVKVPLETDSRTVLILQNEEKHENKPKVKERSILIVNSDLKQENPTPIVENCNKTKDETPVQEKNVEISMSLSVEALPNKMESNGNISNEEKEHDDSSENNSIETHFITEEMNDYIKENDSSTLNKKVKFDDKVNHELLIQELENMRMEQERVSRRQRKPCKEIYENDSNISHSEWLEYTNGEQLHLSSCQIFLEDTLDSIR